MRVKQTEVASFVRRVLGHPDFNTQAKRMEKVICVSHASISVWRLHEQQEVLYEWNE